MPRPLPADIRRLVLASVPSVPFLEALMLLHKHAGRRFACGEAARQLYLDEAATMCLLEAVVSAGFCRGDGDDAQRTYCFERDDEERAAIVDRLAQCYASHLVEMTNLIHDKTQRSGTRLAGAFKLRRDR